MIIFNVSNFFSFLSVQSPSQYEKWYMKGALDVVLRHCSTLLDGSPLTEKEKQVFEGVAVDFGRRGLRGINLCMVPL
jgi:magnesium-transporting ATPase (P-type)